jgi:6-pyruvoyltetrahydropterin/6-carboxytetrahydropterin synthase
MKYSISKYIEIDAAHRVTYHDSKCRNVHGHRYRVELHVCGEELQKDGGQEGMLMDFSFMKDLLNEFVDANCDHGIILWNRDPLVLALCKDEQTEEDSQDAFRQSESLINFGSYVKQGKFGKMYIVPFIPTAENLARHWYELLKDRVAMRSKGHAQIQRVRVYETPTSVCDYPSI